MCGIPVVSRQRRFLCFVVMHAGVTIDAAVVIVSMRVEMLVRVDMFMDMLVLVSRRRRESDVNTGVWLVWLSRAVIVMIVTT